MGSKEVINQNIDQLNNIVKTVENNGNYSKAAMKLQQDIKKIQERERNRLSKITSKQAKIKIKAKNLNKICDFCGREYEAKTNNQKYCNKSCGIKSKSIKDGRKRSQLNLSSRLGLKSGVTGKINEMLVAIDLVKRGWCVYAAFEDTHPFYFLIMKDNKMFKVEVKTGRILNNGKISYVVKPSQKNKHDIVAVVTNLIDIKYIPEII